MTCIEDREEGVRTNIIKMLVNLMDSGISEEVWKEAAFNTCSAYNLSFLEGVEAFLVNVNKEAGWMEIQNRIRKYEESKLTK